MLLLKMFKKKVSNKVDNIVSAGGVIIRKYNNEIFVCIVKRRNKDVWIFPRGRKEANEKMEDTVIREIKEEAGVHATIIKKIGVINYSFYSSKDSKLYNKIVHFYLLKLDKQYDFVPNVEIEERKWVSLREVKNFLTYDDEKKIIDKVLQYLDSI